MKYEPARTVWFGISSLTLPLCKNSILPLDSLISNGPSGISAAIQNMPDREPDILRRRVKEHRANMQRVVDGVKAELHEAPDPDKANPIFD